MKSVHSFIVFDYFLFNFFTISGGELHKVHDYYVFDYFLIFSSASDHKGHDYYVFDYLSIISPFQPVSYIKCMIIVCLTVFFTISDCFFYNHFK